MARNGNGNGSNVVAIKKTAKKDKPAKVAVSVDISGLAGDIDNIRIASKGDFDTLCNFGHWGTAAKPDLGNDTKKEWRRQLEAALTAENGKGKALSLASAQSKSSECWKFVVCGAKGRFADTLQQFGNVDVDSKKQTPSQALSTLITNVNKLNDVEAAAFVKKLPAEYKRLRAEADSASTINDVYDGWKGKCKTIVTELVRAKMGKPDAKLADLVNEKLMADFQKSYDTFLEKLQTVFPRVISEEDAAREKLLAMPADQLQKLLAQVPEKKVAKK